METLNELIKLTKKFIDTPSISGNEAAMGDLLEATLEGKGFEVKRQEVAPGRDNIFASLPGVLNPKLILNTHYDTVPPFIPASEDEDWIWGRGACDTKGAIAAQILAAESLVQQGITDIGLLFVVGEEVDHCGMIQANKLGLSPLCLITAEPTECLMARGQKGAYRFRLEARGISAHSGYPETGKSAIAPMIESLYRLQTAEWPKDQLLGPTTVNIGKVEGGLAANIVPDFSCAEVFIRVAADLEEIRRMVRSCVSQEIELTEIVATEPHTLGTLDGFGSCVVAFHTDIPYFHFSGTAFLWGPGSIRDAHTQNERIKKTDLLKAYQVYQQMVLSLLNG